MECIFFNLFNAIMTDHFFDVRVLIKCIGTNKFEGFVYDYMRNMIRNPFAGKNIIFRCHHREEDLCFGCDNVNQRHVVALCFEHERMRGRSVKSALTGKPLILL